MDWFRKSFRCRGKKKKEPTLDPALNDLDFVSSVLDGCSRDDLSFNPATSHAVCIGVGWQDHLKADPQHPQHLKDEAENDACAVATCFRDTLEIPESQIEVLTCEKVWKTKKPVKPTRDTILDKLRTAANQTGPDGILLVHASCHGEIIKDKTVAKFKDRGFSGYLIPADYYPNQENTFISYKGIIDCFDSRQVKKVILLMDACHSAQMAREICATRRHEQTGLVVFASCSPLQVAMQWSQLKNGLFSFLLTRVLKKYATSTTFPVYAIYEFLSGVTNALQTLHGPGYSADENGQAVELCLRGFEFADLKLLQPPITDGPASQVQTSLEKDLEAMLEALPTNIPFPEVELPRPVVEWMESVEVASSIALLKTKKLFDHQGFEAHTLFYFARSVVQKLYDHGFGRKLLNPRTAAAALLKVSPLMYGPSPGKKYGEKPSVFEMKYFVRSYKAKTASLMWWHAEDDRLKDLKGLLDRISSRQYLAEDTNGEPEAELFDLDLVIPTLTPPNLTDAQWANLNIPLDER